ncbi:WXG100 family type VII secretion target [Amycolatopsis magusensis]|uniref:WXG100 family type VII secretion target n=1 Tax=Amycolatopsis magusensis TaxID=882444 RepID=UPI0037B8C337
MTAHTNFGSFSHQQLYAMLHAGDPGGARAAAEKWRAAGFGLFEQADNLMAQLSEFEGHWTGGAADKYQVMIDDLVGGIRKVGQTAVSMRHLLEDAADELETAKAQMPPPVSVPEVSPADLSLAVNPPLLPPDTTPDVVQAAAQRRAAAIGNVEAQQQAANAANAAHSKAIQVMTDLAGDYTAAEESIPASPNAVTAPPMPGPGTPGGGASGGGGAVTTPPPTGISVVPGAPPTLPGDGTQPMPMPTDQAKPSSPLFGNMFTAGLAAASAAAFGRFGSIMPKVPPWAGGKKEGDDKLPGGDGSGKLGDGFGGGAAGGGGGGGIPIGGGGVGGIGGGGVGGVGGVDLGSPGDGAAAAPGMAGSGGAGNAMSGLAGGAAGAAGAAAAKGMMPMMPMMPMGMGAGGDMGSGRRIPPWLVETEDVWGESSVVAPSVIGEEPDAPR